MNTVFKKISTVLFGACFVLFPVLAQAQEAPIKVGIEGSYPPFSETTPSGKIVGFDIDILDALCAQMKRKCVKVPLDFDGTIPALQSHKIDMILASMAITPVRAKVISFSQPYYKTPARFIARKGSNLIVTPQGLKGKIIGIQRGTTHQDYMEKHFPNVRLKLYTSQSDLFLDMGAGRIDGALLDTLVAKKGFLDRKSGKDFTFFGKDQVDAAIYGTGIGIGVRKGDDKLRKALNSAILAIRKNGVYQKINAKYFAFDIYGQDK